MGTEKIGLPKYTTGQLQAKRLIKSAGTIAEQPSFEPLRITWKNIGISDADPGKFYQGTSGAHP